MTDRRIDIALLGLALVVVIGLLVWRVVNHGVLPIAPDDAAYIAVGRQILAFHLPRTIGGNLYTIRSWAWPVLIGGASRITGEDAFRGPLVLGVALGGVGLAGAVTFSYRRRGGLAALVTALALAVSAVVWEVAGSTRVDVALVAFMLVTICVAAEPSRRLAVLTGALAGCTLLVKESSALLVLLPFAWIGTRPFLQWRRDAIRFWVAFAVVVSWWFVIVLVTRGELFPLQGYHQAVGRTVPRGWTPSVAIWMLVGSWGLAAVVLALPRGVIKAFACCSSRWSRSSHPRTSRGSSSSRSGSSLRLRCSVPSRSASLSPSWPVP